MVAIPDSSTIHSSTLYCEGELGVHKLVEYALCCQGRPDREEQGGECR
jgi:hypothetical protein